ncbi:DUF6296 family protein [Streptomyces sp. Sge12]|uniref:DUF6296 family protein n=1 Tax=Streptomyces sp. Sge12 TaxID=1972846 RepID=UPI0030015BBF
MPSTRSRRTWREMRPQSSPFPQARHRARQGATAQAGSTMGEKARRTDQDSPRYSPLQHQGGMADDHGRLPGSPSRTATGTAALPADPERVRDANTREHRAGGPDNAHRTGARPAEPGDRPRQRYELAFPDGFDGAQDRVVVSITGRTGAGGHPVYEDASGIIQAEISDRAEVRILTTGALQELAHGVTAHPLV